MEQQSEEKNLALTLIDNQLLQWKAARADLNIQVRVAQSIGDGPEVIQRIRDALLRCEKAISKLDELREEEQNNL